jgi:predicted nucleic acid-binding protein
VGLSEAVGPGPIALDSVAFIYFIEEHPTFAPLIAPVFEEADRGERELVTSALTLLEVLVVPYRAGALSLAERYEVLLTRSRGLVLVDMDRVLLRSAAGLRAMYGVRTPDALQLAAALTVRCGSFVTNDRAIPPIPGLEVIQLGDLV